MTADTLTATDTATLWALDFDPAVPCDSPSHARGMTGCEPAQPAKWRVIICHFAPGCEPLPAVLCDGNVQFNLRELAATFTAPPGTRVVAAACGACGKPLAGPDDLLVIVGEV